MLCQNCSEHCSNRASMKKIVHQTAFLTSIGTLVSDCGMLTGVDKLKVDHRLSVFSYNGTLIKRIDFDVCNLIGVDFGYYRPTDQTIIDKPQKRAREAGSLIKNKMEPQKIDEYRIKNYIPGEPQIVKTPTTKPTLSVGGTITNSGSSGGGLFFNSKKDGEPNKFKARKD